MTDPIRAREQRTGWLLLIPALLVLLLVYAYPIGRSFWLSLYTQNLGTELQPVFSGFENYGRMAQDGRFWQSIFNTTVFTLSSLFFELVIGMGIALVLNQAFRGRSAVRTIAIIPWALPTALIATTWAWIFNAEFGVWNDILMRLNIIPQGQGINWLGEPTLAMMAVIAADVWKTTPFISILLLAGLQSIPGDLYEAAAIDGCEGWRKHWDITLPLMRPYLFLVAVISAISATKVFEEVFIMTQGGPRNSSKTLVYYVYERAFQDLEISYACTIGLVTFLIILSLSILRLSLNRGSTAEISL